MNGTHRLALLAAAISLLLAGCAGADIYRWTLITGGEHRIRAGETWRGDVLMLAGQLTVEVGGDLQGSLLLIEGAYRLDGQQRGDISSVGGTVELRGAADLKGDLLSASGTLMVDPEASISGEIQRGPGFDPDSEPQRFPASGLLTALLRALPLVLVGWALARWFTRPLDRITAAAVGHPVISSTVGVFVGIVSLVLVVQMAFTVVLIPVSFLLGTGLLLASGLTWIIFGHALSGALQPRLPRISPAAATGLSAAVLSLVGRAIGYLPTVGGLINLVLTILALGAIVLTRFGFQSYSPQPDEGLL